jgi:hypothetical protein
VAVSNFIRLRSLPDQARFGYSVLSPEISSRVYNTDSKINYDTG